jgi:hypothetical protein
MTRRFLNQTSHPSNTDRLDLSVFPSYIGVRRLDSFGRARVSADIRTRPQRPGQAGSFDKRGTNVGTAPVSLLALSPESVGECRY